MSLDNTSLGDRLQRARRALGLTQTQIGEQMKMATSTVSDIEAGKRVVNGPELYRFAKLYQRPLSYFFEAGEPEESPGFAYLFREVDESVLNHRSLVVIEQLTDDYAAVEELANAPSLPMPPEYTSFGFDHDEAETIAEMERARLGLGD